MSRNNTKKNLAFIDGQNLYYGTRETHLKIDYEKLRVYLRDKYDVDEAYYFFGYIEEEQQDLYTDLQRCGFIVTFREHSTVMTGQKKGNVDTEIVFEVMRTVIERSDFDKVVLISGDGDYKKMVDFLIDKNKFEKILFPNAYAASSLYKQLPPQYFDHLENKEVRKKIEFVRDEKKQETTKEEPKKQEQTKKQEPPKKQPAKKSPPRSKVGGSSTSEPPKKNGDDKGGKTRRGGSSRGRGGRFRGSSDKKPDAPEPAKKQSASSHPSARDDRSRGRGNRRGGGGRRSSGGGKK